MMMHNLLTFTYHVNERQTSIQYIMLEFIFPSNYMSNDIIIETAV